MIRKPRVAGTFYPGSAREIREQVQAWLHDIPVEVTGNVRGGIVPHAGWVYSGRTAMYLFKALWQTEPPETLILFGAVHTPGVHGPGCVRQWRLAHPPRRCERGCRAGPRAVCRG